MYQCAFQFARPSFTLPFPDGHINPPWYDSEHDPISFSFYAHNEAFNLFLRFYKLVYPCSCNCCGCQAGLKKAMYPFATGDLVHWLGVWNLSLWIEVQRNDCAICDEQGKMDLLKSLEELGADRKRLMVEIDARRATEREWEEDMVIGGDEELEEYECEDEEWVEEEDAGYDGGNDGEGEGEEEEDEEEEDEGEVDEEEEQEVDDEDEWEDVDDEEED
ncbi:hypothetical protein EV426DRAFT_572662 [Tirmania nivea]|nr:hypothetical protein EV426DRAFT_572662 [Tirmania nivea]